MGLFEKIFGAKPKGKSGSAYGTLTAYQPVFRSYNGQIYENELVRASIHTNAVHRAKLKVEFFGHGSEALAKRLRRPNSLQTWSQFIYRLSTIYDCDNTAFIVPIFDKFGRVTEIFPVLPSCCEITEVNGEPWAAFRFASGKYAQCPIWQVGIMTKFQYRSDFFGETNSALTPTMELIEMQDQGITEGIKSAASYRFMAQYSQGAFSDDLEKEQERFNERAAKRGGFALLFPKEYDNIKQIESKPFVIDPKEMEFIRTNVFDYFGTNEDVLQNKSVGDSMTAFYEGNVENFAIQFSEVMTFMLQLCGNLSGDCAVTATANRLQYMANRDKLNFVVQLSDRGMLNRDEGREAWNLPPLPDGQGQAYIIRGEYKNADEQVNEKEGTDDAGET